MADPIIRWAIKYVRPWGDYIDAGTIRHLRSEAWRAFHDDWGKELPWSHPMNRQARNMRRKREVRAIRVEIREVQS